jgi:hypothetical protein
VKVTSALRTEFIDLQTEDIAAVERPSPADDLNRWPEAGPETTLGQAQAGAVSAAKSAARLAIIYLLLCCHALIDCIFLSSTPAEKVSPARVEHAMSIVGKMSDAERAELAGLKQAIKL